MKETNARNGSGNVLRFIGRIFPPPSFPLLFEIVAAGRPVGNSQPSFTR